MARKKKFVRVLKNEAGPASLLHFTNDDKQTCGPMGVGVLDGTNGYTYY